MSECTKVTQYVKKGLDGGKGTISEAEIQARYIYSQSTGEKLLISPRYLGRLRGTGPRSSRDAQDWGQRSCWQPAPVYSDYPTTLSKPLFAKKTIHEHTSLMPKCAMC